MNTTKEKIKNVLICVLLMGMVYFIYSVWFFDSPFDRTDINEFFGDSPLSGDTIQGEGSDVEAYGIRPLAIFLRTENFSGGSVYDSAATDEIYKAIRPALKKAFAGNQNIEKTTEEEWKSAILQRGVFFDYRGDVPFGAIKLWLGESTEKTDVCARFYMLSCSNRNVVLYMKNSDKGIYKVSTRLSSEELEKIASELPVSPAILAAESEEDDFGVILPETVILESGKKPSVISAYNTFTSYYGTVKNACLESFRLNDVTPSTYSESDGTEVFVADMITVKLLPQGIALYSDTREMIDDTLGIGVEYKGEIPGIAEMTESARALCADIVSHLPEKGELYLIGAYKNGDESEIIFGRHIDGIPIDMKESIYFARVIIKGESVRAVRINLRGYISLAQAAQAIPERLAAAAVNGSGKKGDLNLRYTDNGNETISPSWFIGGVKRAEEDKDELVES